MQELLQASNDSDAAQADTARTVAQQRVLADDRPEAVAQRKVAEMTYNSPRVLQQRALSGAIQGSPRMLAQRYEVNALFDGTVNLQGDNAMPAEVSRVQRDEKTNKTGLPNLLKSGIESLSGMSMDHVTVHYNSDKPAQLQAHAYAQGSEIHLGAGQERHLPHEAWHVVQQAQGRVRPTLQMKAGAINDDPSLEKEADMMGEKAAQFEDDHSTQNLVAEERVAGTERVAGFVDVDRPSAARTAFKASGWSDDGPAAVTKRNLRELLVSSPLVLQQRAFNNAIQRRRSTEFLAHARAAGGNGAQPIQRYLIVGNEDLTREYKERALALSGVDTDAQDAALLNNGITILAIRMINALDQTVERDRQLIDAIRADAGGKLRRQLGKWVEDKVGAPSNSNPDFGRKNQPRVYKDYKDLAIALVGWVDAKTGRHLEKEHATRIQGNDAISYHLDSVLLKLNRLVGTHAMASTIYAELASPQTAIVREGKPHKWNIYQNYFAGKGAQKELPSEYVRVMQQPANYDVREKIGILHDLMHYFYEKKQQDSTVDILTLPALSASVLSASGGTERQPYSRPNNGQIRHTMLDAQKLVKPEHMPGQADSVGVSDEEAHPSYQYARVKKLPMYGRHSGSAARMMAIARRDGGRAEEVSAVGWAIMSYWRRNYDHTSIPYHTTHEIMDFAPDFDVDYNPDDRFAGLSKFTDASFIATLQRYILASPADRDVAKLITKDTPFNIAKFFLANKALWSNASVMNFLKTTALPQVEFEQLPPPQLREFFNFNAETRAILPLLSPERRAHVAKQFWF